MFCKKIFSVLPVALLCFTCSGCGNEASYTATYEIDSLPKNIDPQLASSESELLIVRNIFEGLMRVDKDGNVVTGAAESYEISEDSKCYTFHLRQSLEWSNGTALTASDFVFALQRASDPQTMSPYTDLITPISGAQQSLNGKINCTAIGVTAIDAYTLQIKLNTKCDTFLASLTNAVYMPCNKAFFNKCGGKYGLDRNNIISNGSFELTTWKADSAIKLSKSESYHGEFSALPAAVYLTIKDDKDTTTRAERLNKNDINMAKVDFSTLDAINETTINLCKFKNTTYALVFNKESTVGKIKDLTIAFNQAIDLEKVGNSLPDIFSASNGLIPPDLSINGITAKELDKTVSRLYGHSPETARELFLRSLKSIPNKTLPNFSVLCVDDSYIKSTLTQIISGWQQVLGAYVNIETVSSMEAFIKALKSGNYTAAFVPLSSSNGNVTTFLKQFTSDSVQNYYNFSDKNYDSIVTEISTCSDITQLSQLINNAENLLLNDTFIIPVFSSPTAFAYSSTFSDVSFFPFGGSIDFAYISLTKK